MCSPDKALSELQEIDNTIGVLLNRINQLESEDRLTKEVTDYFQRPR